MTGQSRSLIASSEGSPGGRLRPSLLVLVAITLVSLFLLAPWPLSHKAHALLHGLCAQRPSHSLTLGGQLLPFDARMTGIYGGFGITTLYLLLRGRFRAFLLPSRGTLALLGIFVAALAVDGSNAFMVDIGRAPLYQPDNRIRLVTGLLTGIALAAALCYLSATTLWRRGSWSTRTVNGPGEVLLLVALQLPFALAATSGSGWLYAPIAIGLVIAAVTAVGIVCLSTIVLSTGKDRGYNGIGDLQVSASVAVLAGLAFMVVVAGGRFWLEHSLGLKTLP